MIKYSLKPGEPGMMGVSDCGAYIRIQIVLRPVKECGILLYLKNQPKKDPIRIPFPEECRFGSVYCCHLYGVDSKQFGYLFYEDETKIWDPYAKAVLGHKLFGLDHVKAQEKDAVTCCLFVKDTYAFQSEKRSGIPFSDSIFYMLHARGFTKDPSSNIKEAGTFLGIEKKISYLKNLGVTSLVFQPIYEFDECSQMKKLPSVKAPRMESIEIPGRGKDKINYWGYTKGYYFAPKAAYAYGDSPVEECKHLFDRIHKEGMEVILQFFFPEGIGLDYILNVLRYWTITYRVDGFHLLGTGFSMEQILRDPFLQNVKILGEEFLSYQVGDKSRLEEKRYGVAERRFMDSMRCFLKGDENQIQNFLYLMRRNPSDVGIVNYLASFGGFRLYDVVSYERKHNEENGEDNRDGETYNCSWNCGVEGESNKRSVLKLRKKLVKNALCFLFLAAGAPMIFMGDEYGKTGEGNNNPYCVDSPITWKSWKYKAREKDILQFTTALIALRKSHPILHRKTECLLMDSKRCGFADLSYHGREAWKPDFQYYIRHVATMLCGLYESVDGKADDSFYCLYNMHWEEHEFAIPRLPKDLKWEVILDTAKDTFSTTGEALEQTKEGTILVAPRSVMVCRSVSCKTKTKK